MRAYLKGRAGSFADKPTILPLSGGRSHASVREWALSAGRSGGATTQPYAETRTRLPERWERWERGQPRRWKGLQPEHEGWAGAVALVVELALLARQAPAADRRVWIDDGDSNGGGPVVARLGLQVARLPQPRRHLRVEPVGCGARRLRARRGRPVVVRRGSQVEDGLWRGEARLVLAAPAAWREGEAQQAAERLAERLAGRVVSQPLCEGAEPAARLRREGRGGGRGERSLPK